MTPYARGAKPNATASLAIELRAGDRIEKYELLRSVANGGMGAVWAAKLHGPHGFEKIVAIKTVLPELAGDARVRAMFLDEARLASAIHHRNVAQVIDFLEQQEALYIVLEWVDGISLMTLRERLAARGACVPIGIGLRILADTCAGLHAAHELAYANGEPCGVVHRDVSPHNILVATEGMAKLIDFGVAKTRLRVAPDSTLGQLRGRLAFMAPEQAQLDPLDRRADIWSVGASLFYLLAGHGPFGSCERTETLRRLLVTTSPLAPPPHTHRSVERVLSGCLARRREDRFPTAAQLGWAIEEAIEDMGVAASARDVAELLDDCIDRADPSVVQTGRCAIPRELTLLRSDSNPCIVPESLTAKARGSRTKIVGRVAGAFACIVALDLAVAGVGAERRSSVPVVSAEAAVPIVAEAPAAAPSRSSAPPVRLPPPVAVETPLPEPPARPQTKRHSGHVETRAATKAKTGHERFSGTK